VEREGIRIMQRTFKPHCLVTYEECNKKMMKELRSLAKVMLGRGVLNCTIHAITLQGFWDVKIEFRDYDSYVRFKNNLSSYSKEKAMNKKERERRKSIEEQIKIHEFGKKEIKTTVADIEDAYNNATCDETRDTLKRLYKGAFGDEWQDVTERLVIDTAITGKKTNGNEVANICGYLDEVGGLLIFTFDGVKFYEWERQEFKIVYNRTGGISILRKR
jgi:hypothetical protein